MAGTCSFAGCGVKGNVCVIDDDEIAGNEEHAPNIAETVQALMRQFNLD